MNNQALQMRREAAIPRGVGSATAIHADRAENAELWDVEGRRFIDFAGGIAVVNTGHRHPRVMAAAAAQMERFTHTAFQVAPYEAYIALAERLNAVAPDCRAGQEHLVHHRRRSDGERDQDRARRHRSPRRNRLCRRLPRPHAAGLGDDGQGRTVQARLRAPSPSEVYHLPFPDLARQRRGRNACARLTGCSRPMSSRSASRPSSSNRCRAKAAFTSPRPS